MADNAERFKMTVMDSCDIIEACLNILNDYVGNTEKEEFNKIHLAKVLLEAMNNEELIAIFITKSYTFWNEIKDMNEEFFVEHANNIFGSIGGKFISNYGKAFKERDTFGNLIVDEELRGEIWKAFIVMVKISIKYIHETREPCKDETYLCEFMNDIFSDNDLSAIAKEWNVKLIW